LKKTAPSRILFLAVPSDAYPDFFKTPFEQEAKNSTHKLVKKFCDTYFCRKNNT